MSQGDLVTPLDTSIDKVDRLLQEKENKEEILQVGRD